MDELRKDVMSWLTTCPSSDGNYPGALKRATNEELNRVIEVLTGKAGNKSRILACQRELRKRIRK